MKQPSPRSRRGLRLQAALSRLPPRVPITSLSPKPTITFVRFENGQELDWPILQMAPRGSLITGSTGSVKTNYISHFERGFVLSGGGMQSIDPDGSQPQSKFVSQLEWIEETGNKHRRVEMVDLNNLERQTPFDNVAPIPGVHPRESASTPASTSATRDGRTTAAFHLLLISPR